jgi:hypothetical protein
MAVANFECFQHAFFTFLEGTVVHVRTRFQIHAARDSRFVDLNAILLSIYSY